MAGPDTLRDPGGPVRRVMSQTPPPHMSIAGPNVVRAGEKRWHPRSEEWVIVAAHRRGRPWTGHPVDAPAEPPAYVADCYLCPGNQRVGGAVNPSYDGVFVFDNDHPSVGPDAPRDVQV